MNFFVLQAFLAFLKVLLDNLDVSSQGEDAFRISKEIKNIISQLADKDKELQYAPKNKKTEGRAHSTYERHWKKCIN
jgi:hypothetical protein